MRQTCKFNTKPSTIVNGGYKKGRYIVWLNLNVSEIEPTDNQSERFQSETDRLVMSDNTVQAFLKEVSPAHLAMATNEELETILSYFGSADDLESWKAIRKVQIEGYDQSDKVNCFYLDGVPMWLDKATRVGLINSLNMEKKSGRTNSTLWAGTTPIHIDIELGLALLQVLEIYAIDCFGVTAANQAFVEDCQSVDELRLLDIGAEYAEILRFNIAE